MPPVLEAPVDLFQVTALQADAADETAISSICEQALEDEGRLDVFFAGVRSFRSTIYLPS